MESLFLIRKYLLAARLCCAIKRCKQSYRQNEINTNYVRLKLYITLTTQPILLCGQWIFQKLCTEYYKTLKGLLD